MRSEADVSAARFIHVPGNDLTVCPSGSLLEFVGGALRNDRTVIDDDDPITEDVGLFEILGCEQRGDAGLSEVAH